MKFCWPTWLQVEQGLGSINAGSGSKGRLSSSRDDLSVASDSYHAEVWQAQLADVPGSGGVWAPMYAQLSSSTSLEPGPAAGLEQHAQEQQGMAAASSNLSMPSDHGHLSNSFSIEAFPAEASERSSAQAQQPSAPGARAAAAPTGARLVAGGAGAGGDRGSAISLDRLPSDLDAYELSSSAGGMDSLGGDEVVDATLAVGAADSSDGSVF
jgi:hypothetical protein